MGDPDSEIKQRAVARVGSVLRDKWRLDGLLGLGGMAAVYAATHRNGKLAAIKVLHAEAALVPDVKARFLREGYLANKVQHPGAVNILDDDVEADGTVFLVMELLEGETLDTRWNREKLLEWRQVFVIADKVLDVLIAAHKKEIVHRDLKPGNVFICSDGSVKILDFGIARLQTVAPAIGDTGGHISLGTPGFMPPEQARGRWARVDAQSDLWSLGATMFAVLADRYVHEAATVNEQLLAAMTEPAPKMLEVLAGIPVEAAEVVDRALCFDKQERWPDAVSMKQALHVAYEKVCAEPMSSALALNVPDVSRLRSVLPDAPTVAATDLDSLRLSTSRPVSTRRQTSERLRMRRQAWQKWGIVAGGAGIALVGSWIVLRSPVRKVEAPSATAISTVSQPASIMEPSPPLTARPAAEPVGLVPPASPPDAAAASERARESRHRGRVVEAPPPAPIAKAAEVPSGPKPDVSANAPSGAPSAQPPIDIFTRRK